jgi:tRNA (guanine-N7-)-methyltransferase
MTGAQKRSYEEYSGKWLVPFVPGKALDAEAVFAGRGPLCVEIGFGMGTATAVLAAQNPGINYLGIEVHRPGIGRLLWEIETRGLSNIRVIEGDAVDVLSSMSFKADSFHIFFPDPWPKKRHHKRRLVQGPFAALLAQKLKKGGCLYMVTDWEDYARQALAALGAAEGLENRYDGFAPAQSWRPRTKFEQKGIEKNHRVWELMFERG